MPDPVTTGAGGQPVVIAQELADLDPSDRIIDSSGQPVDETEDPLVAPIPPVLSPKGDGDWTVDPPGVLLPLDGPHSQEEKEALGL